MDIEIINNRFQIDIFGFGGFAINKDYSGTAFKLSGKMWDVVKANNLKNKGMNIWVYDVDEKVFAGIELYNPSETNNFGLEQMEVTLEKYAYFKHIGPYNLIKEVGQNMSNEIIRRGYEIKLPYIEIYGHWKSDQNKLETELLMSLK